MPSVSLEVLDLSFSFSDAPLLEGVSFSLGPGWTGLVGPNGAGKSTLLGLLGGTLTPMGGQVRVRPLGARVVPCAPRPEGLPPLVRSFLEATDREAARWRAMLELPHDALLRFATLSPGERQRAHLGAALWSEPDVLLVDEPTNHLDEAARGLVLASEVALDVARDEHVALEGRNGAGKSTLLATLERACTLPGERVLSLPQELGAEEAARDLELVRELPPAERGRVLQLVDALGVDPDRLLASRAPSSGEARKLRLALGLGRAAWPLLLDEPTNDLDLPSVERLEAVLATWPGALVLVSHDSTLVERVCSRRVRIEAGVVREGR